MRYRGSKLLRCFLFTGIFVLCMGPLMAQDQSSVRGQLRGTVLDASHGVVPDAAVTIMGPTGSGSRTTNDQGEFMFQALIPGFYAVKVEKPGFKTASVQSVEVLINRTSTIRVSLELGAVSQTVEVVGSAILVESSSSAVTTDLADTVYQNLPLTRSVSSIFYVAPGVSSGLGTGTMNPGISGATGLENAYVADGVLLNDAAFGGLGVYHRRYGGLGTGINLSFVKEVQVNTAAFGPEIGHTTGGLINIVTKSGGSAFHGVAGGYFQSRAMGAQYANQDDFHVVNHIGRELQMGEYEGDFELGGYVPLGKLRDHLFFFGAFNPTWNHSWVQPVPTSGLFTSTKGLVDRAPTIWDYSAKLTFKLNDKHTIESSVFGDPTHTALAPWQTLNIDNVTANSQQNYGSRNWATRYDGTFGGGLLVDAAFTWNWNRFSEAPLPLYNITDQTQIAGLSLPGGGVQRGAFRAEGFGFYENYDSNTKGLQFSVSKAFTILGTHHTISAGYTWQFPTYNDYNNYSGPAFSIPLVNASGADYFTDPTAKAAVAGQSTTAHFLLERTADVGGGAAAGCTLCPYMTVPGYSTPQQVVLLQDRGIFSNGFSNNSSKYHAAYINDSWEMGTHATLNVGLRWEQQRMNATGVTQLLNDQWNPRIGFIVDPKGDRKSKIYVNFARYAWIMPLDAAIRELSGEKDYNNIYFAPKSTLVGGVNTVSLDQYGSVIPVTDAAHLLNNATGGVAVNPTVSVIAGGGSSPFLQPTRMEYNDEFVVGAEHEFRGGIVVSVRYIDRRIKRIIEDFQGLSIEQYMAGRIGFYAIGNVNAATDATINPKGIVFSKGATFSGTMPAGCYDSNGNAAPNALNLADTFGNVLGSACFPSVNMQPWTHLDPSCTLGVSPAPPTCPEGVTQPWIGNKGALFGGESGADGKPDGYLDPKREYQAIEIEVNKALSHNWSLTSNWRISRLRGNFEGAYRNDNGQNDPGISSLFDFTPGLLNTIGFQMATGSLNSDRLHIINIYPTYVFDKGKIKGLTITPGVKIQTGVPLTTLAAQEAYQNSGEVPLFGRGDLGRSPVTGTVDVHVEYPVKLGETRSLRFAIDMFNIANTKRELSINQNVDLSWGALNADFKKPGFGAVNAQGQNLILGFVQPFSSRATVSFNF